MANFFINIVMIPLKLEKQVMIATVVSALVNIGLNVVLIPQYAENAAAFTTLLAEITMTLIAIMYCKKIKMKGIGKPIIAGVVGGIPIILICHVMNRAIDSPFINIVMCVLLSGVAYGLIILVFYRKDVIPAIKQVRLERISKQND